jgi:hypothetical protein
VLQDCCFQSSLREWRSSSSNSIDNHHYRLSDCLRPAVPAATLRALPRPKAHNPSACPRDIAHPRRRRPAIGRTPLAHAADDTLSDPAIAVCPLRATSHLTASAHASEDTPDTVVIISPQSPSLRTHTHTTLFNRSAQMCELALPKPAPSPVSLPNRPGTAFSWL